MAPHDCGCHAAAWISRGGEIPMLTSSRYLINRSPTRCEFCGEPFPLRDGYVEFWRTSAGHHFCSEFCADDAEEAQFIKRHAAETSTVSNSTPV
jgi:MYM-type Zinc finger with FCS sequence motif